MASWLLRCGEASTCCTRISREAFPRISTIGRVAYVPRPRTPRSRGRSTLFVEAAKGSKRPKNKTKAPRKNVSAPQEGLIPTVPDEGDISDAVVDSIKRAAAKTGNDAATNTTQLVEVVSTDAAQGYISESAHEDKSDADIAASIERAAAKRGNDAAKKGFDAPTNTPPKEEAQSLPDVDRERILDACVNTSVVLAVSGLALRQFSDKAATRGWFDGKIANWNELMPFPNQLDVDTCIHLLLGLGAAAVVTVGRIILLSAWADFKTASDTSNRQVLTPLRGLDVLQVAAYPAISEELLFRGFLLPAVGNDLAGIAVAGVVFGVLHIPGGRNPAFAVWASAVGMLYGALAVYTHDLAAPMVAHAVANLASATYWRANNLKGDNSNEQK
mmetsp:Transcript_44192/g.73586  ORF Transcript_44192/g.73586 Transcript_44192/m.73586 type:complete len:387 (-) Transcript_44192:258-1418(-)